MVKSFEEIESFIIDLDDCAYQYGKNCGKLERWSKTRKKTMAALLVEIKELCEENERLERYIERLNKEFDKNSVYTNPNDFDPYDPNPVMPVFVKIVSAKYEIDKKYNLVRFLIKHFETGCTVSICRSISELYIKDEHIIIELAAKQLAAELICKLDNRDKHEEDRP